MTKFRFTLQFLGLLTLTLTLSSLAQAQATRTWVSGVGDDVNPCSRTAPCKTFAGAISKTAKDGEINALDSGGFGTLTITKSITVDGTGTLASSLAALSSSAFNINITDPADIRKSVRLRGLSINGASTGTTGIKVISSSVDVNLAVEDVVIDGFTAEGIFFNGNGGDLSVVNTSIRNCATKGIMIDSSGANFVHASIDRSNIVFNQEGLRAETNARVSAKDSNISNNSLNGVVVLTVGGTAEINLHHCLVAHNRQWGVYSDASGGSAVVRLNDTMIVNNTGVVGAQGVRTVAGGLITSAGNNVIDGNTTNGTVTGPAGVQ